MGLDFRGANARWSYGGFNRFRERLAREIGIDLQEMEGFNGKRSWAKVVDPIAPLLSHSDCDGEMTPNECYKVAPRLLELVKDWPDDDYDKHNATKLAEGMLDCAISEKPLIFC